MIEPSGALEGDRGDSQIEEGYRRRRVDRDTRVRRNEKTGDSVENLRKEILTRQIIGLMEKDDE